MMSGNTRSVPGRKPTTQAGQLLQEWGWTARSFALQHRIDSVTFSQMLSGRRPFAPEVVVMLNAVLGEERTAQLIASVNLPTSDEARLGRKPASIYGEVGQLLWRNRIKIKDVAGDDDPRYLRWKFTGANIDNWDRIHSRIAELAGTEVADQAAALAVRAYLAKNGEGATRAFWKNTGLDPRFLEETLVDISRESV